ncbi:FAD:protein FMN transferase, partial [Candidatus Bipolaricaulota bacterium]|nr:FAD:protein FMN transferase [Candidatus Bipolaricaulota bacterium]
MIWRADDPMGAGTGRRNPFASWWPLLLIAALAAVLIAERVLFPPQLDPFTEQREMMDTWVSITIYASDEDEAHAAIGAAFARMVEVVAIASIYDPAADAARLNATGRLDNPAPELVEILEAAV